MRNHPNRVRRLPRCSAHDYTYDLPDPHDIRLQDVYRPILDQLPTPIPVVLVLSRRPRHRGHPLLQQLVPGNIVRVQNLFPPLDVDTLVDTFLSELDGVVNVQGHVAVDHDREVGADVGSALLEELDVLLHSRVALVRTVREGYLPKFESDHRRIL